MKGLWDAVRDRLDIKRKGQGQSGGENDSENLFVAVTLMSVLEAIPRQHSFWLNKLITILKVYQMAHA